MDQSPFPHAGLSKKKHRSLLWTLPLIAILLVTWLFSDAWQNYGATIEIRFQEGHGLKAGDTIRYRGIAVGTINSVVLDLDDNSIAVGAQLHTQAAELARTGSRFWIVRPQVDLSGARGLETVIGPRYVTLIPGQGQKQHRFVGLERAPVTSILEPGGLEIVLTTAGKGNLRPGAPITYRQIVIGRIAAVDLARDASKVEARAHIQPAYVNLIRRNCRFWKAKAASIEAGFSGVSVALDSVRSLVLGGVNLAIPPDPGARVAQQAVFPLFEQAEEEWLAWIPGLVVNENPHGRPLLAAVNLYWRERNWYLRTVDRQRSGWALVTEHGLIAPADLLTIPPDAKDGGAEISLGAQTDRLDLSKSHRYTDNLFFLPGDFAANALPGERIRSLETPEDSLIFAAADAAARALGAERFVKAGEHWQIETALTFTRAWHGAAVVSQLDNKVTGLLLVDNDNNLAIIAPIPEFDGAAAIQ